MNPTLLTLLRAGCKIIWPDGCYLSGDVRNQYIDIGHEQFGPDGVWSLDRDGLASAMNDLKAKQADLRKGGE